MLDNKSSMLLSSNVRLTGNIKLVVDSSNKLFLELIPANQTLKSSIISNIIVDKNGEFVNDIYNKYKSVPNDIFYGVEENDVNSQKTNLLEQFNMLYSYGTTNCVSKLHTEQLKIFAPLLIGKTLPKYFVIFKVDNLGDEKINQSKLIIGNKYIVQATTPNDYITSNNVTYKHTDIFTAESESYTTSKIKNIKVLDYIEPVVGINQDIFSSYIKKSNIVKVFDFQDSSISTYLSKLTSNKKFSEAPLRVDFNNKKLYYTGISKDKGEIITVEENFENLFEKEMEISKFDRFITDGYMRNGICLSNLINFEFLFDDNTSDDYKFNRYFGLYVDELTEDDIKISILENDNIIHYIKDIYTKDLYLVDNDTKKPKNVIDYSPVLIDTIQSRRVNSRGVSSICIEIVDKLKSSDELRIFKNGEYIASIIADELDNLTVGDYMYDNWIKYGSIYNYFNPIGSISEIAERMCITLNNTLDKFGINTIKYFWNKNKIYFYLTFLPDIDLRLEYVCRFGENSIYIENPVFTGIAKSKNHRFLINKSDKSMFDNTSYIQTMSGKLSKIKNFSHFLDLDFLNSSDDNEILNFDELNNYVSVTIGHAYDEVLFTQKNKIYLYKDKIFKKCVFDILPIKSFFTDFEEQYKNPHIHEYNKYYNILDNQLIVGETYYVFSYNKLPTSILHNDIVYNVDIDELATPVEFTAVNTSYSIVSGIPTILNKKYYNDSEIYNFSGFYGLNNDSTKFSYQLNVYKDNTLVPFVVRSLTLEEDTNEESLNQWIPYDVVNGDSFDDYYVKRAQNFVQAVVVQEDKIKYLLSHDFINEYQRMKEGINKVYDDSKLLPFVINRWSMKDSDVRGNNYRLNISPAFGETNQCPAIDRFAPNQEYFTNEWFYISSYPELILPENIKNNKFYFDKHFESELHKSDILDYFTRYFTVYSAKIDNQSYGVDYQKRWSVFNRTFDNQYDVLFNGIKYRIVSDNIDYSDYKFAVILNVKKSVDNGLIYVDISTNHIYKSICICINVEINDYKITDKNGNLRPDYVYMYMMRSLVSVVGDNVVGESPIKVYGQPFDLSTIQPFDIYINDIAVTKVFGYKLKSFFNFNSEENSLKLKTDPLYLRNVLQSIQDLSILIDENKQYIAPLAHSLFAGENDIYINNLEYIISKIEDYKYQLKQTVNSYVNNTNNVIVGIDNQYITDLAYVLIIGGGQNIYIKLQQLLTASSFFRLIQENKKYINNSIINDGSKLSIIQHTKLKLNTTYNVQLNKLEQQKYDFVRLSGEYYPETFDVINFKTKISSEIIKESKLKLDSNIILEPTVYSNDINRIDNSKILLESNLEIDRYLPYTFYGYNIKNNQKYELDNTINRFNIDIFKNIFDNQYTLFDNQYTSKLVNISDSQEFDFLKTFFNSINIKLPFNISSTSFKSVSSESNLKTKSSLFYIKDTSNNQLIVDLNYKMLLKDIMYDIIKDQIFKYSIINSDFDNFITLIINRIFRLYSINLLKIYSRNDNLGVINTSEISESYLIKTNYKQITNYSIDTNLENGYSEIILNKYTDQSLSLVYNLTLL